jgi:hypothetical protein
MACVLALLTAIPASAAAKIEVKGQGAAIYVSAEDASVGEVLTALSAKFNLTISSADALDRPWKGAYSGTLQKVLRHILVGYNYITKYSAGHANLKVLGPATSLSAPSSLAPPSPVAVTTSDAKIEASAVSASSRPGRR